MKGNLTVTGSIREHTGQEMTAQCNCFGELTYFCLHLIPEGLK
jgi:hypothetical protein